MRQRLRLALRTLARTPGFSAIAVLTLALGLGANASLFTILDAVVLEPLPYPRADRLVVVRHPVPGIGAGDEWGLSVAGYFHFQREARSFEALGAFNAAALTLGGDGPPERAETVFATASLLDVLGARPALGRLFGPQEDVPGGPAVAILSHDFWLRRYGGDAGVIGRRIDVSGAPREIVGVLAPGVHLPDRAVDVWMPYGMNASAEPVNSHYLVAYGRLREGVTPEAAQAELVRMIGRFPERFPGAYSNAFIEQARFTAKVVSLRDDLIGGISGALWVLLGAVGIVLLIACANVANLLLVRAESRRREVALRAALGATRGTLARLFLTESLVLAALAGALALGLAAVGVRALVSLAPPALPRLSAIALDGSTVAFTVLLALLSGLAFGVFPLLRFGRALTYESLREGGRGMTAGRARLHARNGLVVAQVALALILLAGASLMLESFRRLRAVEPGFTARGVLTFDVLLPAFRYQDRARAATFYDQLVARLGELPGVEAAGAAAALPLEDPRACYILFREQAAATSGSPVGCIDLVNVAPGYFSTLAVGLRGREFESTDVAARRAGVVLSRGLAERLWPGEDAIGKGIKPFHERPPFYRVIGVVDDVRADALDAAAPEIAYFPLLAPEGEPGWSLDLGFTFVIRTRRADPVALEAAVRAAAASLDPTAAVANVRPLQHIVDRSMVRTSFTLMLLGIAAAIALLLGAVGIYGVISYVVGQRSAEIGVRVALGARASQVRALVLGQSLRLAAAGVAAGLAGALALTRSLRSLLYDVSASDPVVLGAVSAILIAVALLAAAVPAARAARVDPMRTLRGD